MKKSIRLRHEVLEDRAVPSSSYSIDGTGNNLNNPAWGSVGAQFLRTTPSEYGDGTSSLAGSNRPSPRVISNALAAQSEDVISDRLLSAMIYAWGQFIDHDLDLTFTGSEPLTISVPAGDPYFDPNNTGTQVIATTRSVFDPATGTTNPRQQVNAITAWMDGSMVYGSDTATAASLRTFVDGKMKTSEGNLLPVDATGFFQAGDIRVNENPELTSLHTIFVREHNRWATAIKQVLPNWSDEQIYQEARALVIAEIQVITYREWLPALLGSNALRPYQGYRANVNPGISNEFATAGFRLGHSLLGDDIEFLDNNGLEIADEVALADAFFNPDLVKDNGIESILKYLASDPSSELDNQIVDGVRNFLFGPPGAGGLDLASLNIARGRDHGLADYNRVRQAYGLPRVTSFNQITSDPDVRAQLQQLYGSVDDIDLWVGALAENHVPGGSVGPTLKAIITRQFERLRDGDRFWYQRAFSGSQLYQLEHTTLTDVIRRNSTLSNLQSNAFFFRASIGGSVFGDFNRNHHRDHQENGRSGVTVRLVNADDGELIATATTDAQGRYTFDVFDGLRTGEYIVQVVVPAGWISTTPQSRPVAITRGEQFRHGVNFGIAPGHPGGGGGGGGPGLTNTGDLSALATAALVDAEVFVDNETTTG